MMVCLAKDLYCFVTSIELTICTAVNQLSPMSVYVCRTVILRLASVAVLVMTLGLQLLDCPSERLQDCQSCIANVYVS